MINNIVSLLTSSSGSMVYHLLLSFSILSALIPVIFQLTESRSPQLVRRGFGLALLLLLRLALFLAAGLGSMGFLFFSESLPMLNRLVDTLTIITICWLWLYPQSERKTDTALGALSVVLTIAGLLAALAWVNNGLPNTFNDSRLAYTWNLVNVLLLLGGGALLILSQPEHWTLGLIMAAALLIGEFGHLLFPNSASDYPFLVRLMQIAAFPLLLGLPELEPKPAAVQAPAPPPPAPVPVAPLPIETGEQATRINQNTFISLLTLINTEDIDKRCPLLCKLVAQTLAADYCFLLSPPDDSDKVTVVCGYDLIRDTPMSRRSIDQSLVPGFVTVISNRQMLTISASSQKLAELAQALGLPHAGALLGIPIQDPNSNLINVLALFSPQSGRAWTADEQDLIQRAMPLIAGVLQTKETSSARDKQQLEEIKARLVQLSRENERLIKEMANLQVQNLSYEEQIRQEQPLAFDSAAVEQITRVTEELTAAQQRIRELEQHAAEMPQPLDSQPEMIASMVQELRQPLASITGYTELLLSETIGELTPVQRKFIHRVKNSTDRMTALIADLTKMTELDANEVQLVRQKVDLGEVIDEVINLTGVAMRQKQIVLRVDLPRKLPQLQSDRGAIQQILMNLMQNASAITPAEGEVRLRGEVIQAADQPVFVRFAVMDSGEGIPPGDLPRVFTRLHHAENPLVPGIGDTGVGLSIARSLAKKLGGDLTVESVMGQGSIFKLVLPVNAPQPVSTGAAR